MWWIALVAVCAAAAAYVAVPLFRRRQPWELGDSLGPDERTLDALFEEKARVLRALKDLDHELEAGMLSATDHAESRADWLARAVLLNRRIEALTGVKAEAAPAAAEGR